MPDEAGTLQAFERPLTDVLVTARAHSRGRAARELNTAVAVGPVRKQIRVRGDRRVRLAAGGRLSATETEPFEVLPITWERAYGGRDRYAEKIQRAAPEPPPEQVLGAFAYPRNAGGRGFWADLDVERLDGELLPNLDDPHDPVEPGRLLAQDALDWIDRPAASAYAPIDELTFPRCAFHFLRADWRTPTRPIYELRYRVLSEADLRDRTLGEPPDPRVYQRAPTGLATHLLSGGERVSLYNLHPDHELVETDLPADRPQVLIEPPGTRAFELEPSLKMVHLEPEGQRVTMVWTADMEVAAMYPQELCASMRHGVMWGSK